MRHLFIFALLANIVWASSAYDGSVHLRSQSADTSYHLHVRHSALPDHVDRLSRDIHNHVTRYAASNLLRNARACSQWKVGDYWCATLLLFGFPYPLNASVNLSPEYTCFYKDNAYKYYVRDADRYSILEQWHLYEYDEFWKYIRSFPDYQECIFFLEDVIRNKPEIHQQLSERAFNNIQQEIRSFHKQQQKNKIAREKEEQQKRDMTQRFANQAHNINQAAPEYAELLHMSQTYGVSDTKHLEERCAVIHEMRNGFISGPQYYTISQNLQTLLREHGCSETDYTQHYGNTLQQLTHRECISLLERVPKIPSNSVVYPYKGSVIECIDAAREYNQIGLTYNSLCVLDFCRSLLNYGQAVVTGAAQGIVGAVQDCVEHPLETALCVAAGEYMLGYQLCKLLFNVADIAATTLYNFEQGSKKWHDFIEPVATVIDALANKQISLRDSVQGATQLAVQWKAQIKLLSGLSKFFKTAKIKALEFAEKNPLVSPEKYLATPEGLVFRAGLVAENNKLPTCCTKSGNIQSVGREIVVQKVATYEQARNMGLKIIGDVDMHSGVPMVGKQGPVLNKLCGRRWHGYDVTLRLDWDPIKGAHVNVTDYRIGKRSVAIPFNATEDVIESLCRPFNTRASLEAAKLVFEKVGDARGLAFIAEVLD